MFVRFAARKTYMFPTIPNQLDPFKVSIIVAVAVVSSVVGSLIPASARPA